MAESAGTILTSARHIEILPENLNVSGKENRVKVIKIISNLNNNFETIQQHQNAKIADIARQQEMVLAAASNRAVAEERGKRAAQDLKQKQFMDMQVSQKALNSRMKALRMEQERAGFIASLPPPSKDPITALIEKYDDTCSKNKICFNEKGRQRFFDPIVSCTKDTNNKHVDARSEAIIAEEIHYLGKEMKQKWATDQDGKTNERFKEAIVKEQLANSENDVIVELEQVYRVDRLNCQQKIVERTKFKKIEPVGFRESDKQVEKDAEKAVKEALFDLDLNESNITRRKKKKIQSRKFFDPIPSSPQFNFTMTDSRNQSQDATWLNLTTATCKESKLEESSTENAEIVNGISVDLSFFNPAPRESLGNEKHAAPATPTLSNTVSSRSNTPCSFFSPPAEFNNVKSAVSTSIAQRYEKYLLQRAEREKKNMVLPTTRKASSVSTTPGIDQDTSVSKWPIASTPHVENKFRLDSQSSSSLNSSSKLSMQFKMVLDKYIDQLQSENQKSETDLTLNFKPKIPQKFFGNLSPLMSGNATEKPIRHRTFPEKKSHVSNQLVNKTGAAPFNSKVTGTKDNTCAIPKPATSLETFTNRSETSSLSLSNSSSTLTVGSSGSDSSIRTKNLPQKDTEFRIPTYVQHKFLTDKMKYSSLDSPIETIDDLREILACLPNGIRLEECIRQKPPISYPYWVDEEMEPHELSTIHEVDSFQTSHNYSVERVTQPKASEIPDINYATSDTKTPLITENVQQQSPVINLQLSKLQSASQPKWGDILKSNFKVAAETKLLSGSTPSPRGVEALNPDQIISQSTPVKEGKRVDHLEDDLWSENLTLIGPEVTVSDQQPTLASNPHEKSMMSESLLSFMRHEEEMLNSTP